MFAFNELSDYDVVVILDLDSTEKENEKQPLQLQRCP